MRIQDIVGDSALPAAERATMIMDFAAVGACAIGGSPGVGERARLKTKLEVSILKRDAGPGRLSGVLASQT